MNNLGAVFFFIILVALVIFLLWFYFFKLKHLKPTDLYMVDGGVKTGKSLISVMLAVKAYRKAMIRFYVGNVVIRFINIFRKRKKELIERPMLYSNMPLYRVKYNALSLDIILGKVRIPYRSVCLLDEATLIADSMLGMNTKKEQKEQYDRINEALTLFLKTYGHMTHGGKLVYNSQQVIDLHFAFKRNTAIYCWVARTRKYPFFCLSEVREVIHDESHDVMNVVTRDVELDDRPLFVSKRYFKYYDRYYLDVLTKNLPVMVNYDVPILNRKVARKEIEEIVTLGNYHAIREYNDRKRKEALKYAKK